MRLIRGSLFVGALLLAAAAACGDRPAGGELAVRAAQPIQGGTVDKGDPAVVGILISAGGGVAICSGSLIAPNLVLTAHHCVAQTPASSSGCSSTGSFGANYAATSFRVTSSYDAAAKSFGAGTVPAVDSKTWFGAAKVVVAGSDICGGDMAVIELAKPMTGVCPLIPRVDAAVAKGEAYTAVGFGITSPSGAAAGTRYTVSGLSVQCAANCGYGTSATLEWVGGSAAAKGTCEGDSGGPALDAAGRVLGTVSRGPAGSCNQTVYVGTAGQAAWIKQMAKQAASDGGYAAAGWVGGGATSDPANGYCGSSAGDAGALADAGSAPDTGTPTPDAGSAGACGDPATTCLDGSGAGDFGCFAAGPAFPASAAICSASAACASGFSCWATSAAATTGYCVQDCTAGAAGPADAGGADTGSATKPDTGAGGGTTPDTGATPSADSGADPGTDPGTDPAPSDDAGATADTGHKTVLMDDTASAGGCASGRGPVPGGAFAAACLALGAALAARDARR